MVTDADVIGRSLVDGASFAILFDRYYRALHRFLRARVGPQLADDLVSETFARAFRGRGSYDLARVDARPWLYGIAVNLLHEHRRAEERRLRAYARASPGERAADVEEPLDETVAAALLDLSEQDRTLILLHAWAELSYEELADALGIPLGTVRSRLSRTRAKLRVRLAPAEVALVPEGDDA